MDDLITWLRACLVELENGGQPDQHTAACGYEQIEFVSDECTCGIPARVLREVEAKRRLLRFAADLWSTEPSSHPMARVNRQATYIAHLLALPFSDRPGYRPEWRP